MVRHISHEIRTPLNTISIGVEVLEHELSALGEVIPNSLIEVCLVLLFIPI
jgi:signal transduction histidine kinase